MTTMSSARQDGQRRYRTALLLLVLPALAVIGPPAPAAASDTLPATVARSGNELLLANGFVRAGFDLSHPQIDSLQADFHGSGNYGGDLTASGADSLNRSGIVLERTDAAGEHASSAGATSSLVVKVLKNGPDMAQVRIDGVVDDASQPLVTSTWTLTLQRGSRTLGLGVDAHALRGAQVGSLRLSYELSPTSVYGLFARGATQRIGSLAPYFASTDALQRFYAIGRGAVDVTAGGQSETVLLSGPVSSAGPAAPASGLEQVLTGAYAHPNAWDGSGWAAAQPTSVLSGQRFRLTAQITPNQYDFPAAALPAGTNMPFDDLRAFLTAVYGTSAGMLDTYALPGEAAPSLASPTRTYGDGRNFYDPDTWMIDSALLYSGDPYLEQQARTLIEKSGDAMSPSGQIPHHFKGPAPTYTALSGATQTGPNIFWISAALRYVESTGDYAWLRNELPTIEKALNFLVARYDPTVKLVNAPGPLWIDVFIRQNYTSDTNAFMVEILREVADAEAFLSENDLAAQRRVLADDIVQGMNARLWSVDHYVTQLNPDGTMRDLLDYDSNLLAVGFGVAPPDRAGPILGLIDSGPCTHARPTWVSGIVYGPTDTYGRNMGDSLVTMGRIGWADAVARRQVGDRATFENEILGPVENDLLQRTWLTERYDCFGNATRAPYYYEYPSLVVMLLREIAYGIDLGLQNVTIDPFTRTDFRYHLGFVDVSYSSDAVRMTLPGSGTKSYAIHGLVPATTYRVTVQGAKWPASSAVAGTDGVLRFSAPIGAGITVSVKRAS
jgi:hypothetical protein